MAINRLRSQPQGIETTNGKMEYVMTVYEMRFKIMLIHSVYNDVFVNEVVCSE